MDFTAVVVWHHVPAAVLCHDPGPAHFVRNGMIVVVMTLRNIAPPPSIDLSDAGPTAVVVVCDQGEMTVGAPY